MKQVITAKYYWEVMLKESLRNTGYLPKELYYVLSRCEELHKYITPEIIRNWYKDDFNLDFVLDEIFYTRGIELSYFSQSRDTRDLEDCIAEYYDLTEFVIIDDETAEWRIE